MLEYVDEREMVAIGMWNFFYELLVVKVYKYL